MKSIIRSSEPEIDRSSVGLFSFMTQDSRARTRPSRVVEGRS